MFPEFSQPPTSIIWHNRHFAKLLEAFGSLSNVSYILDFLPTMTPAHIYFESTTPLNSLSKKVREIVAIERFIVILKKNVVTRGG